MKEPFVRSLRLLQKTFRSWKDPQSRGATLRALTLAVLFCPAFASSAASQSFSIDGDASLGLSSLQNRVEIASFDLSGGLRLFRVRERPVVAEIGLYGYYFFDDNPHETYAAFVYDDRFRIGVMRPAYDLVLRSSFEQTAPAVAENRVEFTRSFATAAALRNNDVPIGLSYTGQTDDLIWGVSIHEAKEGDFRSITGAFEVTRGMWTWAAAAEGVWDRGNSFEGVNLKAGGEWRSNAFTAGARLLYPDANRRPGAIALDIAYRFETKTTLRAFGEVTEDNKDNAYGLAVEQEVFDLTFLTISSTAGALDSAINVTLTRQF